MTGILEMELKPLFPNEGSVTVITAVSQQDRWCVCVCVHTRVRANPITKNMCINWLLEWCHYHRYHNGCDI